MSYEPAVPALGRGCGAAWRELWMLLGTRGSAPLAPKLISRPSLLATLAAPLFYPFRSPPRQAPPTPVHQLHPPGPAWLYMPSCSVCFGAPSTTQNPVSTH
ncbi:hypothetical protein KIL84_001938 [Mauremys mutica]|uniref:Uncharacterized protein n=1 Tax=Mauremys mutica TaxID=74926 RepID=A0A9D4B5D5_9SAUR|nr:hypothetical protein KIL84_001938 [Mauremys mutica]